MECSWNLLRNICDGDIRISGVKPLGSITRRGYNATE